MIAQLDNKIMSSFLLYVDNLIQTNGQAYVNMNVNFYPVYSPYAGTYVYASPLKPICNDTSVTGAAILSGVYLGNQYVTIGQSGLKSINHYQGALYFTGINPSNVPISGYMGVKEVNVKITNKQDWKLLFETEYVTNSMNPIMPTSGLPLDSEVSPVIFLRFKGQENKPFAFSHIDNQTMAIRAIVVGNSEYEKMALTTILKNINLRTIPIVASTPFDSLGNMTGINYNFYQLPIDNSFTPIVWSVRVIDVPQKGDYQDIVRNMAIVDFEISTIG